MQKIDLTGQKFERLTVLSLADTIKGVVRWNCICECGKTVVVRTGNLRNGHTKSCGCISMEKLLERSVTHGMSKSPEFWSWWGMQERCYNPKCVKYPVYGGRGIKVCDRWLGKDGFQNFLEDMGGRPSKGYTVERDDANGDYETKNCRWATNEEQSLNKRSTIRVWYKGEFISWKIACRKAGIDFNKVRNKCWNAKISHQKAFNFFKPIKKQSALVNHLFSYIR